MTGRAFRIGAAATATLLVGAVVMAELGPGSAPRPARAAAEVVEIHSAHSSSFVPALQGKRPLFILALGSDARPGENITHLRADSIHLIGIDVKSHRATILGFPRDSWVNIPGYGTNKINTSMALGGPSLMVRTIESLTGIHIDFWVLTAFSGFKLMVNGIGGLTVKVTADMHDPYSGADFSKGTHHLTGGEALSFARDRHDVPGGDLGRSANQGKLLQAALSKLHVKFDKDPSALLGWVALGWTNLHTDLGLSTLLDLGLTAVSIPSGSVNNLVVPASVGTVGTASVVFLSPSASSVYADMRVDGIVG